MKHPKTILAKIAGVLTVLTAVFTTVNVSAWGPERQTYTNNAPASYATFNSITDNVAVGDERNFVRVREAGTNDTYVDELEVVPGKEYEVYVYYHNDAASNTNSTGYGVATNVRMSSAYPTVVNPGERGMVSGIISWSFVTPDNPNNAQEGKVWDEAYLTTKTANTVLRYKTGTAVIHNGGAANGQVLSTDLFTEAGTPLGFNKLTGTLPGCAEYSGYVTYTLVAESTTSELTKEVSTDGETWKNAANVTAGDYVTYRVTFKNTGNTTMTNVIFKDTHSDGLSLRAGSTKVYDVNHTDGLQIDDILDLSGYNVGNVAPGALVQIIYQARTNPDNTDCTRTLSNKISVEYNGAVQQESSTNVSFICAVAPETPESPAPSPETPSELPNTGPAEIVMAVIIVLVIVGGGIYLWRTKHALNSVKSKVSGKDAKVTPAKATPQAKSSNVTEPKTKSEPNDKV
ncbi:DUF11 domain-containing protein [Candidatus Saccharibacteria bacterium]|nr:DUF11 domain-containing protein [Candidatus Saccharibacteria bacterium]